MICTYAILKQYIQYRKVKKKQKLPVFSRTKTIATVAVAGCLAVLTVYIPLAQADQFDEQIKQLQTQNEQTQSTVSKLAVQANSYQDAITKLQERISSVRVQIAANQAKQAQLQAQIEADQKKLDEQKQLLGADLKAMYVSGDISTVEMLATSKNLSAFVDAETYRAAVQTKIQNTLTEISKLQNQLKDQQTEVNKLLADQQAQGKQLAADQDEQNNLLALNQNQQATYNQQIQNNKAQIADLRAQQAAENARLFAGNGSYIVAGHNGNDNYPDAWRTSTQDSLIDNWGMFNRECVSYTAWKVASSGRHMPYWGGIGNANQWDDNARAAGIPVDSSPRNNDVAIKNSQPYGHAMFVQHVYADGAIYVSQYNASLDGTYSEAYLSAATVQSSGLVFIHFP